MDVKDIFNRDKWIVSGTGYSGYIISKEWLCH